MADNLRIWSELCRTDPKHTKQFKRAGGFSGTAIKPIYCTHRMTEQFGPCGEGWGIGEPQFQVVNGHNHEVLVYCTVSIWWQYGNVKNTIFGVGGDKIVTHIKANEQYNRAERWENDDEAFKKAFTDAIGNAMKHLGMSADIHMGLFDDSKYVKELRDEFKDGITPKTQPPKTNTKQYPLDFIQADGNVIQCKNDQAFLTLFAANLEAADCRQIVDGLWDSNSGHLASMRPKDAANTALRLPIDDVYERALDRTAKKSDDENPKWVEFLPRLFKLTSYDLSKLGHTGETYFPSLLSAIKRAPNDVALNKLWADNNMDGFTDEQRHRLTDATQDRQASFLGA